MGTAADSENPNRPGQRQWPKPLIAVAILLMLLDAARMVILPPSYQEAFMDGFEAVVVLLCAVLCWFAARRSSPVGRGLWTMTALFFVLTGAADLHDFFGDLSFGAGGLSSLSEVPGWCMYLSLSLLIFFPVDEEGRPDWSWLPILDFVQVTVAVALTYFRFIYLPHILSAQPWTYVGPGELTRNFLISGGLLLRSTVDPSLQARGVYRRVGGVFAAVSILRAALPGYSNPIFALFRPAAWLVLGILAARWEGSGDVRREQDGRRAAMRLVLSLFAAATLFIVVVLALGVPGPYQKPMYAVVGISVMLFILRTYLAEKSRHVAEARLRSSERDYRVLFESAVIPIVIFEPRSERILQANAAACELYGVPPGGLKGGSLKDFTKDVQRGEEQIADLVRTGVCRRFVSVHRTRDGREIDVLVSSSVIEYGGQKAILSFNRDITDRKREEAALVRLRQAVDTSGEVVFMTDRNGVITSVNPEFTRLYGYTEAEVVGKATPRILKSGVMQHQEYTRFWKTILGKNVVRGEVVNRAKDGHLVTVASSASPILDDNGTIAGFLAIQRDVTGHKKLEDQLRQAQKMEAVGRLAGGVAHDFNNLLTIINGYALLLLELPDSSGQAHDQLNQILQAGERGASLTRQLLAFSRKQIMEPKIIDLNHLLANLGKMLHRLVGEDIVVTIAADPALGQVKADSTQIEQLVMNLVVNARDAMPRGGKLTIETGNAVLDESYASSHIDVLPGAYVMLAISDTGHGIDSETLLHIFEPFFTTKEQGKGTGLGLSTVYGIVKQIGGHVAVYSEVGRGTTFKVYFPRFGGLVEVSKEQESDAKLTGSETVLVVEDEAAVKSLIHNMLETHGYKVLLAASPQEAVALSRRETEPIHLLLTDVIMPGMSGKELADHLTLSRPEMKVLFISGYTADAIAHHGVLDSTTHFLQKPFTPVALLRKVRETLKNKV